VAKDNPDHTIRYWQSGEYDPSRLKYGWMPPHPTLYVRREIYERAKLPNGEYFDTSMTCAADYDFMMRILKNLKISVSYLPKVLIKMRVGGISNKSIRHLIRKSREDLIAIRRNNIGGLGTLAAKNLRKLPQFFKRYQKV
jgi:glycosyltransferase